MRYDSLELLKGEKIINWKLENKEDIYIETENKKIKLMAIGYCCSDSWIEHMDNIPQCTVIDVIQKDVNELTSQDSHESLKQYFYELVTDKGSFTIEMRNSSNGYYGGHLELKILDAANIEG